MDKQTLSHYGWIVVLMLIMSVMIAMATPFGKYIATAIENTTEALCNTQQKALSATDIELMEQEFEDMFIGGGTDLVIPEQTPTECQHTNITTINASATYTGDTYCIDCNTTIATGEMISAPIVGSATFNKKITEDCNCMTEYGYHQCWVNIEPVTLTWDELKLAENGTKYVYDASAITDTEICNYAFAGCLSLTDITIPDSVTSIGEEAFNGAALTSITIPDSVTSISNGAFCFCESLTSITIPDSVTSIGEGAFNYAALTSITIPDSVTSIDNRLFYFCPNLATITIPDSVTSIGYDAFYYCKSLTSITFNGTKAQWNAIPKGAEWNNGTPATVVHCTDGDVTL